NARSSMLRKNTDFILVCQRCMAERPSQHHGKSVGVDLLFDAFRQHWVPDRKPNNRTTQNSHPARCDIRYFCAYVGFYFLRGPIFRYKCPAAPKPPLIQLVCFFDAPFIAAALALHPLKPRRSTEHITVAINKILKPALIGRIKPFKAQSISHKSSFGIDVRNANCMTSSFVREHLAACRANEQTPIRPLHEHVSR